MEKIKEKLSQITTFIFDFDGVLSDGKIYVFPDGDQIRATSVKDGYAIQYALKKGYHVAIISGGFSDTMRLRYKTFPGMDIFLSVPDKVAKLNEYMKEKGLSRGQVLIMGDDIPDYDMMQLGSVRYSLTNFGGVFSWRLNPDPENPVTKWRMMQFGVGYNRINDFNNRISSTGLSNGSSWTNNVVNMSNGIHYNNLTPACIHSRPRHPPRSRGNAGFPNLRGPHSR